METELMRNITIKLISLLMFITIIAACDNNAFNEIFRNPYVVEVANLDELEANKWYEFDVEAKALNRDQEVIISFDGSRAGELFFSLKNEYAVSATYRSKKYPNKEIAINVVVINSHGKEYELTPVGSSGGILFSDYGDVIPVGDIINKIKIKGNVNYKNLKATWISRTGR